MGSVCNESFAEFLDSLKAAGIEITSEADVRERLAEVQRWRQAFMTLAANGQSIGIRFCKRSSQVDRDRISRTFARYQFPEKSEALFVEKLASIN